PGGRQTAEDAEGGGAAEMPGGRDRGGSGERPSPPAAVDRPGGPPPTTSTIATPERPPAGPWARAVGRGLALLLIGALAKAILALTRLADGGGAGLMTPWAIPAMLAPEVWAAAAVALVDLSILSLATWRKRPGLEALSWWTY